jgi:hypothetical protein
MAGKSVRITADLKVLSRKYRPSNSDMMRTRQDGAKCANQGIGSVANNGRQLRPYR